MLNQILLTTQNIQAKTALIFNDKRYTYADLSSLSYIIANNLYHHGLRYGAKVALFMDNRPEFILICLAALKLGAVVVPVNYRYKSEELKYVLKDSQADFLITEENKASYLNGLSNLPRCVFIISQQAGYPWLDFTELLNESTKGFPEQVCDATTLAFILYTSGTTSNPKGVMHTHESVMVCARNLIEALPINDPWVSGVTLPICHIAGLIGQVLMTLGRGGTIILFPVFDANAVLQGIKQHQITHLQLVPVNLIELIKHIQITQDKPQGLRYVVVGGDKVSESAQKIFSKLTQCNITEVIGMTESLSYCMNLSCKPAKIGSVGKPINHAIVELIDEKEQTITAAHEVGELIIKSKSNTIGYWHNTKETEKLLKNGWVHSGDLAYRDEDGFYWFVGRNKQIIIRGGSNISPQDIENILSQHPLIFESCVIGLPDKKLNQIVCACIVLKEKNQSLSLSEIRAFCKDKLSDYKIPEKLFTLDKLPHNTTGKLDRVGISQEIICKL